MKSNLSIPIALLLSVLCLSACGTPEKERSLEDEKSNNCTINQIDNVSYEITCPDGSSATIKNGTDGQPGTPGLPGENAPDKACVLIDSTPDGIHTMDCGDGPIVLGNNCPDGYPGDVTTQAEQGDPNQALAFLDLFGCTTIQGDLIIRSSFSNDPYVLDPAIAKITHVGGSIFLNYTSSIENFALPNLQSVGKNISINNANDLKSLSFASLKTVGGSIYLGPEYYDLSGSYFDRNEDLKTLSFPELTTIDEDLLIISNPELASLSGFPKLHTIGGNLAIENNVKLNSISGLGSLTEISGSVHIMANQTLQYCEALAKITTLPGFTAADTPDAEKLTIEPATSCP